MAEPPRRPRVVVALLSGTVCGFGAWAIGVHWSQSLLVGIVVVASIGAYHLLPRSPDAPWGAIPYDRGPRARRDVSRLSWVLHGSEGTVSGSGMIPLRSLAERRLALRGLSLNDPHGEVSGLLGSRAHAILADPPQEIRLSDYAACVEALEKLDGVPLASTADLAAEGLAS